MTSRPDVFMIGSCGRNVGKTMLACEVVRRQLAAGRGVTAVKITTIKEGEWLCPHGTEGCGICGSFEGDYLLTEEREGLPGKDTTRLLEAGAARVFWLRVRNTRMQEGLAALWQMVPGAVPVIMESNSARQALVPGLFLVLEDGSGKIKPSCGRVRDLADRRLVFDGAGWGRVAERIGFENGAWRMRQQAGAIVLAGGRSSRMGRDKSFLMIKGRPMIQHIVEQLSPWFDEVIIGANDRDRFGFLGRRVVPDREVGQGPLMGLASCLAECQCELNLVTACDIPAHDPHFLMRLLEAAEGVDIAAACSPGGRVEPLLAVYRKSMAGLADDVLKRGGRRIADLFELARVKTVDLQGAEWYWNLNTMEDYRKAVAGLAVEV